MEAGRELDASVAAKVMGIDVQYDREERGKVWEHRPDDPFDYFVGATHGLVPPYSTDIAAAWEVVRHLTRKPGSTLNLHLVEYGYNRTYAALIEGMPDEEDYSEGNGEHCTPLAICLAALAAVDPGKS